MHASSKQTNTHHNGIHYEHTHGNVGLNHQKMQHRRILTDSDEIIGTHANQQSSFRQNGQEKLVSYLYLGNTHYKKQHAKNKLGETERISGVGCSEHFQNMSATKINGQSITYNQNSNRVNHNANIHPNATIFTTTNKTITAAKQKQSSAFQQIVGKQSYKRLPKPMIAVTKQTTKTEGNIQEEDNKIKKNATNLKNNTYNNKYQIEGIAGKGTFGIVYFGKEVQSGEKIALKKVLQDKKYKNRELDILKEVKHPNILEMKDYFFTTEGSQQYLNVVMDFYGDNLYQVIKKKQLNPLLIKIYAYQMLRGLNYLAYQSIAHRDIKPQNILVNRNAHKVVICDFGSAKKLVKGQLNIAYICSRCYRAPQLIFGATQYTPQIDMWSLGCVIVQMINGDAPFLGDSQIDQLLEIIKVLGTPQKRDIQEMNSKYDLNEFKKLPKIKSVAWKKVVKTEDPLLIDLISKILEYSPQKRFTALDALKHPYFDELSQLSQEKDKDYLKKMKIKTIPQLFDYSQDQIAELGVRKDLANKQQKEKLKQVLLVSNKQQNKQTPLIEKPHQLSLFHKFFAQKQQGSKHIMTDPKQQSWDKSDKQQMMTNNGSKIVVQRRATGNSALTTNSFKSEIMLMGQKAQVFKKFQHR